MADPVLTVETVKVTPDVRTHPLATRVGISLFAVTLEAIGVWSGCTRPQRALLEALCPPLGERLLEERALTAEQMPALPDGTRQSTRDAMERRGLVDEQGRLTGRAFIAWKYGRGRHDE